TPAGACNAPLQNEKIINDLNNGAKNILPAESVLLHFWAKRFTEMAPFIAALCAEVKGKRSEVRGDEQVGIEIPLHGEIAGRKIYARADAVVADTVIDIKTGAVPTKSRLMDGNMPQLPLSVYMLQRRGALHAPAGVCNTPLQGKFLQLKNSDCKWVEYSGDELQSMIDAAVQKTRELIGQYTSDGAKYEWREDTDAKYKGYDDLARK
ncbi:MAG: hypothetical protein FWC83_01670, partial [Alphaproteobacteria bacterium]|nr:hypothetical protein [Alphaproteobacteria bacterium]